MFGTKVSSNRMADGAEHRTPAFIPMVYEHVKAEPTRWEYHVLTIDTATHPFPSAVSLNELGSAGWLMVSVLDERVAGKDLMVHYYFIRQTNQG